MSGPAPWLAILALAAAQALLFAAVGANRVLEWVQTACASAGLPYNTVMVLAGSGLLGVSSAVIGSYAVLRRRSLIGDAVAHAALPGIALAYLIARERNFFLLLLGALVSGVLGAAVIAWLRQSTRTRQDAAIGLVLSVFFGLGIVLTSAVQRDPTGAHAGLEGFLLGKTAGLVSQDLLLIAVTSANILILVWLFQKEFLLLSFDPGFAAVQRWPVQALDVLMMTLLVAATVIGLPAVGVVLMAAMLIIPGVAARFWTDRLSRLLPLAGAFGLGSAGAGTYFSSVSEGMPTGPVIVLTASGLCLFSMFAAPRRGIAAGILKRIRMRERVARQNLLRTMYELAEEAPDSAASLEEVAARRGWRAAEALRLLRRAERRGELRRTPDGRWALTEHGLQKAMEVVRAHRLWELYLVEQASIAADHVDRDADELEHILPPEMVLQLESRLRSEGRWPEDRVPASVHPIESAAGEAR